MELAIARLSLSSAAKRVEHSQSITKKPVIINESEKQLVARVAYAIPRVASCLPWRTDCLVQALAAERWLKRSGVSSLLIIGVKRTSTLPLEAHAWLKIGDQIVIGGDVSRYIALTE